MRKPDYKHLIIARSEFLKLVGAPNESLRLIIIYYIFKYTFVMKKKTVSRVTSEPKKPFKGSITAKLVILTLF